MNSLKIILRGMFIYRGYTLINILGLALGMSVVALISIYIFDELGYENTFENKNQIARVVQIKKMNDAYEEITFTPEIIPTQMKAEYPEIIAASRVYLSDKRVFHKDEEKIYEENLIYVDPDFLDIFSYNLLWGNREDCLEGLDKIVLTESLAKKYFGDKNPVGEVIKLDNDEELTVSAVIQDPPVNSHLQFSALESFATMEASPIWKWIKTWHTAVMGYVLVNDKSEIASINLDGFYQKHLPEEDDARLYLQPLQDIHLKSSHIRFDYIEEKTDSSRLYLFLGLGVAVLFLAGVNFVNLSTARAVIRAREIGLRKVVGADRWNLFRQFETESIMLALLAFIPALIITETTLPYFNELAGRSITNHVYDNMAFPLILLGVALSAGFISGIYPALFLSRLRPSLIIRGKLDSGKNKLSIRKLLVLTQFTLSTTLITSTIFFGEQIKYLGHIPLGFDNEHVIALPLNNQTLVQNKDALINELSTIPSVKSSGYSLVVPGWSTAFNHVFPDGYEGEDAMIINMNLVDYRFVDLYDLEVIQGENFKADSEADRGKILINEAAMKLFGWNDINGKTVRRDKSDRIMEVAGVIKDYHFMSLHNEIEPQILVNYSTANGYLNVKISGNNIQPALSDIGKAWSQVNPQYPFDYSFVDEATGNWYESEQRVQKLISVFTLIAIFIACLGLYGLSVYAIQRRTREIGIRKVLGAGTGQIVNLVSMEFVLLVLISTLIASPISIIITKQWLNNFTYQMPINPVVLIISILISFAVVFITTGFQVYQATVTNPAEVLRKE